MMWYGGHGWGWCSMMVNVPAMVLLWSAVLAGLLLALLFAVRRPSDPPAHPPYGQSEGVVAAPIPRSEPTNDEFYRRLM